MARKKKEPAEAVHIYHKGDNIQDISVELTGVPYMVFAILKYSGLRYDNLKDGDLIRWRI